MYITENLSCHDANFVVTGAVVGCHNENKSPVPPVTTKLAS